MEGYKLVMQDPTGPNVRYALSSDMTLAGIGTPQTNPVFEKDESGNELGVGVYRVFFAYQDEFWIESQFFDFPCGVSEVDEDAPITLVVNYPTGDGIEYAISSDGTLAGIGSGQTSPVFATDANGNPINETDTYRIYWRNGGDWVETQCGDFLATSGIIWPDFMSGEGEPVARVGKVGTHWLDTLTDDLYKKTTDGWEIVRTQKHHYPHVQNTPSVAWEVEHNLGYNPAGIVVHDTQGNTWLPVVEYVDFNTLKLKFGQTALAGLAYIS